MPISFRRSVFAGTGLLVPALLLCLLSLTSTQANGQDTPPPHTALQKQLARVDLALLAEDNFSDTVSGIEQRDANNTTIVNGVVTPNPSVLSIHPSNSVGELVTLRYIAKPYVGFEFNFSNARLTQDYTFTPPPTQGLLLGGAQTSIREMTLGYVAHLRYRPFGATPYLGAGGGTIKFTPTPYGGQGLPFQYRAVYYYDLGLEESFPSSHFGFRIGFRQLIYLAPDFLQNYLTITRRERTSEPVIGFYLHY